MKDGQRNNITMESLATVLGGSFLIGYAVLLLWFLIILFTPDGLYRISTHWFAIDRHEFDVVNYGGMVLLKIINLAFFLCPYLSIRLWLRRNRQKG